MCMEADGLRAQATVGAMVAVVTVAVVVETAIMTSWSAISMAEDVTVEDVAAIAIRAMDVAIAVTT